MRGKQQYDWVHVTRDRFGLETYHPPGELPPSLLKRAKTYAVPAKNDAVSATKASAGPAPVPVPLPVVAPVRLHLCLVGSFPCRCCASASGTLRGGTGR
eukprot:12871-Amphidinium_carterae.1